MLFPQSLLARRTSRCNWLPRFRGFCCCCCCCCHHIPTLFYPSKLLLLLSMQQWWRRMPLLAWRQWGRQKTADTFYSVFFCLFWSDWLWTCCGLVVVTAEEPIGCFLFWGLLTRYNGFTGTTRFKRICEIY